MIAMTTTTLAMPDPDDRPSLDEELAYELRWAGAALADPTTDPVLRADLEVTLGSFDVFAPQHRDKVDPQLRANLLAIYRNPPAPGGMFDAVFNAAMDVAKRRKAA